MKVKCSITEVINFLIKQRDKGYTSVELIDDARVQGWNMEEPTLEFIFSQQEPKVVGIDARIKTKG